MYACLHAEGNSAILVDCARHFSPYSEQTSSGTVLIDMRGSAELFGGPQDIASAMNNRAGIPVDVAIARDLDTAIFAARGFRGTTIIPPGQEGAVLAPLSLSLLPCSPEVASILNSWGIRTFGEFAALPAAGIAARLGKEGSHLHRLVRGEGNRQLRPFEDPTRFEETMELESPIELLESLSFLLGRLLHDLCNRLTASSLSADEIHLALTLENAPVHACTLRTALPMRDPMIFLKLLQLELSGRPPAAPIVKIHLELRAMPTRTEQHHLFLALSPEPAKLEVTLSKLTHLLGAENVGTPELLNTHRPDAFRVKRFSGLVTASKTKLPASPALVLRRYRPPRIAQVIQKSECPVHIRSLSLQGSVIRCAGPWRSSGDWWKTERWNRDEWDVALSDGALYRLYEELDTRRWFVEGVYD
jgi:protein ImuB